MTLNLKYAVNVIVLTLSLFSFPLSAKWYQHSFNTMGTRAHIEFLIEESKNGALTSASAIKAQRLISLIMAEMKRIDQAMSPYIESSELSLLNREAGYKKIKVSKELFDLLTAAREISEMSDGAFDITYASIGYQYDYRGKVKPQQSQIDSALPVINYQGIQLDKQKHTVSYTDTAIKIDLGGIAKGYAVKNCLKILASAGVKHALISAGGDTGLLGDRNGRPWLVGIKHPRAEGKNVVNIPLSNEAISTSGDYERYFIEEGKRYHHIINPETGDSAREVVSVSVIGDDATVVDALSTTVFVKGLKQGMMLINDLKDYEAIIIDNKQRLHFSKGLQQ